MHILIAVFLAFSPLLLYTLYKELKEPQAYCRVAPTPETPEPPTPDRKKNKK